MVDKLGCDSGGILVAIGVVDRLLVILAGSESHSCDGNSRQHSKFKIVSFHHYVVFK